MFNIDKVKKRKVKFSLTAVFAIFLVIVLAITGIGCAPNVPDNPDVPDQTQEIEYAAAVELLENGDIIGAYEAFIALDGYKDSENKAKSIYEEYKEIKLQRAQVGDYVFFGSYEQDNDLTNGKEDIEWLVLEVEGNKLFLTSKYGLDSVPYHPTYDNVYWPDCGIYNWLDDEFINDAFSDEERAKIAETMMTIEENKNPDWGPRPSWRDTKGRVFLLTISQVEKYFDSVNARKCAPTAYAIAQGASTKAGSSGCWWWLRTPGGYQNFAANVSYSGGIETLGKQVNDPGGAVRPAMWINC